MKTPNNFNVRFLTGKAPSGPVVTPKRVRKTDGPNFTHDSRYQCAPEEQPFGAGFAAVGVGRDIETGRAWR